MRKIVITYETLLQISIGYQRGKKEPVLYRSSWVISNQFCNLGSQSGLLTDAIYCMQKAFFHLSRGARILKFGHFSFNNQHCINSLARKSGDTLVHRPGNYLFISKCRRPTFAWRNSKIKMRVRFFAHSYRVFGSRLLHFSINTLMPYIFSPRWG